jgi:creatinine amidohydrolase
MLWEELTAKKFSKYIDECGSLCLLPLGVVEKHGDHLPLGTDMFVAQAVSKRAAEIEPAIVFPYYFLGQISIARHYKGCINPSHKLQMEALLEMCDEIGRNGFKKIIIVSSHGGNSNFLPYFHQEFPRLDREYGVYIYSTGYFRAEQRRAISEMAKADDLGAHAGLSETSVMMHIRPDLVDMASMKPEESKAQERLALLKNKGLFSAYNWYADYPYHFAGDPGNSTPETGKLVFDMKCDNLVDAIRTVITDDVSEKLIREYATRGKNPE